jgi:hypothetical protein
MAKKDYGTRKNYHFIYKTTNLLSGRYYIGMHSTDDLNDGYLGSGTLLRRSINKHGKENFKIEILEFVNSREELAAREKEIVSLQEIAKKECMNLKVGGEGGLSNEEHRKNFIEAGKKNIVNSTAIRKENIKVVRKTEWYRELMSKAQKKSYETREGTFKGKRHSEQTKSKMSNAKKGKGLAEENTQYGTCWITNEIENKKTRKGALIPDGWRLGRKIK